jgi:hypothetical protein
MESMPEQILATVVDADGRRVDLFEGRWAHIVDGHPELEPYQNEVVETVRTPSRRKSGHELGEEWFYREGVGPSRWLKVVVRYETSDRGWIVTAFARRSMP